MAERIESKKLTKQDINKVYVRNLFALQYGWNYEKMQGLGYTYVIMPALKRLYKNDPEKMKKALKMQLSYFNTTPAMAHLIVGADMALEEELGIESEETVMAVKTGLMGPLAGVGDTLFIAIYRAYRVFHRRLHCHAGKPGRPDHSPSRMRGSDVGALQIYIHRL